MTTYNVNGQFQEVSVTNQAGSLVNVNDSQNFAFVTKSDNSLVRLYGADNFAQLVQSNGNVVQMFGSGHGASILDGTNDMTFIYGSGDSVGIVGNLSVPALQAVNNQVYVLGNGNKVSLSGPTPGAVVDDRGQGNTIQVDSTNVTIRDFQFDRTGKIDLSNLGVTAAQAVADERSDGRGGTLLSFSNNGALPGFPTTTVDVTGVSHISASHFA